MEKEKERRSPAIAESVGVNDADPQVVSETSKLIDLFDSIMRGQLATFMATGMTPDKMLSVLVSGFTYEIGRVLALVLPKDANVLECMPTITACIISAFNCEREKLVEVQKGLEKDKARSSS